MKSHGEQHINDVRTRAREINTWLQENYGIWGDNEVLDFAAAFHDTTADSDRENHHISGAEEFGKLFKQHLDRRLIERVSACIREHRASYDGEYSSIESQIISTADRDPIDSSNILHMYQRSYVYAREHGDGHELAVEHAFSHIKEKYGRKGYAYNSENRVFFRYYESKLEDLFIAIENMTLGRLQFLLSTLKEEYEG